MSYASRISSPSLVSFLIWHLQQQQKKLCCFFRHTAEGTFSDIRGGKAEEEEVVTENGKTRKTINPSIIINENFACLLLLLACCEERFMVTTPPPTNDDDDGQFLVLQMGPLRARENCEKLICEVSDEVTRRSFIYLNTASSAN